MKMILTGDLQKKKTSAVIANQADDYSATVTDVRATFSGTSQIQA
jgi:beta-lactamase superfamily II metal-dependent hydrolase